MYLTIRRIDAYARNHEASGIKFQAIPLFTSPILITFA